MHRIVLAGAVLPAAAVTFAEGEPAESSAVETLKKTLADRDPAQRYQAAQAALLVTEPGIAPQLIHLLKDDEPRIVEAAVAALVTRADPGERREAARALAARLKPLPREPDEVDEAREELLVPALHDLAQVVSIKALLDIHMEAPPALIRARLMAVGNVPAADAIEALIAYGARRRRGEGHGRAMRDALKYATGTDQGADPDRWRAWWRDAAADFDFEAAAARRKEQREKAEARDERREERRKRRGDKPSGE